jgi:hypothetical protein
MRKQAKVDEVLIGRLVAQYGGDRVRLAIAGAKYEQPTKTFDPAKNYSVMRVARPDMFAKLENLGAQNSRTGGKFDEFNQEMARWEKERRHGTDAGGNQVEELAGVGAHGSELGAEV